jgi:hypothetical protein
MFNASSGFIHFRHRVLRCTCDERSAMFPPFFISYSLPSWPVFVGFSENTSLRQCKAAEYINIEIHILAKLFGLYSIILINKYAFLMHTLGIYNETQPGLKTLHVISP